MQLRREVFTDGATAIGKAVFWIESLGDVSGEPDFKSQVLQDCGLAVGKLIIIGNERTVAAAFAVLDQWRALMQAAIDAHFGHDATKLPGARRAFAETNLQLILALRAELDLTDRRGVVPQNCSCGAESTDMA